MKSFPTSIKFSCAISLTLRIDEISFTAAAPSADAWNKAAAFLNGK